MSENVRGYSATPVDRIVGYVPMSGGSRWWHCASTTKQGAEDKFRMVMGKPIEDVLGCSLSILYEKSVDFHIGPAPEKPEKESGK